MNKELYSKQWNNSSNYFYSNCSYLWMCNQIKKYQTILEVGCGTGQSTLSLVENGHKVIAIEKNNFCIEKAKLLLEQNGYVLGSIESDLSNCDVVFLQMDLFDNNLINYLEHISFDIVICWNIGSYWDEDTLNSYISHMIEYGLTEEQIYSDREASYGELIQWKSCAIARNSNVPIHIIDRNTEKTTRENDNYYITLKEGSNFSKIEYKNKKTKTISNGGTKLTCNGEICTNGSVDIYLNSVLIL